MKTFGLLTMAPKAWEAETTMVRVIVAAPSQVKAVEAMQQAGVANLTVNHLRTYGGQTWNVVEIAVANDRPGTVFWAEDRGHRDVEDYHAAKVQS